jgi:TolB-like protein
MSNDINGKTADRDVADQAPSSMEFATITSPFSGTLQTEVKQLQVAGTSPQSMGKFTEFDVQSVLMMPLSVITDDELTRTFAAGLTEDLQHAVYEQTNLRIVQQLDGQSLQNTLIFSGSVRIYDQLTKINLQLVEAEGSTLLWSGSFECILEAQLQLQARIARHAGEKLKHSFNAFI